MANKRASFESFMKESDSPKIGKTSDSSGQSKNFQSSVLELKAGSFT